MACAAALAFVATIMVATPASAATITYCYVAGSRGDTHNHGPHGDVFAGVDYNWYEETFLRQFDGLKYYGVVGWDKVGTKPTWIAGCR